MAQSARLGKHESRCHMEDMTGTSKCPPAPPPTPAGAPAVAPPTESAPKPREIGGPKGPEPTRYGDWEVNGRCSDF
jgi:hypothetical protein